MALLVPLMTTVFLVGLGVGDGVGAGEVVVGVWFGAGDGVVDGEVVVGVVSGYVVGGSNGG